MSSEVARPRKAHGCRSMVAGVDCLHGRLRVDMATGFPLVAAERRAEAHQDIERFDVAEYWRWAGAHGAAIAARTDLSMDELGYWELDGTYREPSTDARAEALSGADIEATGRG